MEDAWGDHTFISNFICPGVSMLGPNGTLMKSGSGTDEQVVSKIHRIDT
jgi:hypothetical protein